MFSVVQYYTPTVTGKDADSTTLSRERCSSDWVVLAIG